MNKRRHFLIFGPFVHHLAQVFARKDVVVFRRGEHQVLCSLFLFIAWMDGVRVHATGFSPGRAVGRFKGLEGLENGRSRGASAAVGFVLVADVLKGAQDVIHVITADAVKDEVGGVEFSPQHRELVREWSIVDTAL